MEAVKLAKPDLNPALLVPEQVEKRTIYGRWVEVAVPVPEPGKLATFVLSDAPLVVD
jgi:hypothetical protein